MPQTQTLTDPNRHANTIKNREFTEIKAGSCKNRKPKALKMVREPKFVAPTTPSRTKTTRTVTTNIVLEQKESQKLFIHLVKRVEKQTTPQRKIIFEPMQPKDCFPRTGGLKERIRSGKEITKTIQIKVLKLQPEIKTRNAASSLRSCNWQNGDQQNNTSTNPRDCLASTSGDQSR